MKIIKAIVGLLLLGSTAFAQFPTNTISTNLTVATASVSDYNSFLLNWNAENDQSITATFDVGVTNGTFGLRLAKSKAGPIWLELTGWTCSGNSATTSFTGTNVPPVYMYYAEFGIQNGGSFRTLAKGKVNVMSSLWSSTNYYASSISGNIVTTNINIPNFTWTGTFPSSAIPSAITVAQADNATTLQGYTPEQLSAAQITYYVWGSLAGPVTNPASKIAKIDSPMSQPAWTSSVSGASVSNGALLGAVSIATNQQPRVLQAGVARLRMRINHSGNTQTRTIKGRLTVLEADGSTVVDSFGQSGAAVAVPNSKGSIDVEIPIDTEVAITDTHRLMLLQVELVSGWTGAETIYVYSQDSELTYIELPGAVSGVWAPASTAVSRDAGPLKCKVVTGTTLNAGEGAATSAHGLTASSIVNAFTVLRTSETPYSLAPSYGTDGWYWTIDATNVNVTVAAGPLGGCLFQTLIWYTP